MSSDFSGPQILPHLETAVDFTLFDCAWVPSSPRFVVSGTRGDGSGVLRVYRISPQELTQVGETKTDKSIKCLTFGAATLEERHVACGDFGGCLQVFDLERLSEPVWRVKAHDDFINAVDGAGGGCGGSGEGAPEVATASRDGTVKVWDLRVKEKPVLCMRPGRDGADARRDAWAVAFGNAHSDSDRAVAAGYDNGDLKLFDLRTVSVLFEDTAPAGICSLQFDRKDIEMNKLVAACLKGYVCLWDLRTRHPDKGYTRLDGGAEGDKATVWSVRHLPQNREVMATASGSGGLTLWKYEYPEKRSRKSEGDGKEEGVVGKLVQLQDSEFGEQPLGSFAWSPDKTGLGLCTSFDQKIRTVIVTRLNTL